MTDSIATILLVGGLSLLPLLLVVLSSYAKIAIVLTVLRNGIGAAGVPPNLVIAGVALLLSAFVLAPVASAVVSEMRPALEKVSSQEPTPSVERRAAAYLEAARAAGAPIRAFLMRHTRPEDRQAFVELAQTLRGPGQPAVGSRSLLVLAPAFVVAELREAFVIGVAVLLPFLIVDLVVANILLALGLISLPVSSVSMPLKLALFVAVDGWRLLGLGLVAGYG